ncbi:MAG: hypothetical protein SF052_01185 [Bacteroidia bacterium]|nr:hypothetical protein [Bacteroidia bacterium]
MPVALVIDTLSIQTYIFGSNKLKENIGGSYIIEELVYKEMIPKALKDAGVSNGLDLKKWKDEPEVYRLNNHPQEQVEVGYIGGGNALLLFRKESDSKEFIKAYSRLMLTHFPGLKTAFGLEEFNYEAGEGYETFRKRLNENLIHNRNFSAAQVQPFKHGIAEDCPWTNEAQETKDSQSGSLISQMAASRVNLVKGAQKVLLEKFKNQIGEEFSFTDDLDQLGQPDDKGYVAIVHADGNGMGQRFIGCQSLADTRKLSAGVIDYADKVMQGLIGYIVSLFQGEKPRLDWELEQDKESEKRFLPIRPLIIGGDDITFVCEGRLGVHLAEKLLEYMHQIPINGQPIHACAGVAIVHTKYPFYKAYQLAEELTKRAKDASRGEVGGSWLEYMISTGGFSGPLKEIITDQFTVAGRGTLKSDPYRVDGSQATLPQLHNGMKVFADKWPRNKIKDLRDALRKDEAHQNYFLTEMDARKLSLPGEKDNGKTLWKEGKTPYYDMIELIDFYPESLLS